MSTAEDVPPGQHINRDVSTAEDAPPVQWINRDVTRVLDVNIYCYSSNRSRSVILALFLTFMFKFTGRCQQELRLSRLNAII